LRLAALDENWNEVHEEIGNRSILDFRSILDSLQDPRAPPPCTTLYIYWQYYYSFQTHV